MNNLGNTISPSLEKKSGSIGDIDYHIPNAMIDLIGSTVLETALHYRFSPTSDHCVTVTLGTLIGHHLDTRERLV